MEINTSILVGDRFKRIISYYDMTPNKFSRLIGFERSDKIYNILAGKFNPSFEILLAITNKFVDLNIDWLITGRGEMIINKRVLNDLEFPTQPAILSESDPPGCIPCKIKDRLIESQQQQIETLLKFVNLLEEKKCSDTGQKRKAAS